METAANSSQGTNPYRLTMAGDGSYRWACPVEKAYERKQFRTAILVTALVSAAGLAYGAFLDITFMLTLLLPVFGGMMALIILIIHFVSRASGNTIQWYEMNDRYVGLLNDKSSVFHYYDRIQQIVVTPKYLEIHGKIRTSRVYLPQENHTFIRDFILTRVLGKAQVRYENASSQELIGK